jgi:hypothetical protein
VRVVAPLPLAPLAIASTVPTTLEVL